MSNASDRFSDDDSQAPLDEAFATELSRLTPAGVTAADGGGDSGLESLLYEAGYQAGRESAACSRRSMPSLPHHFPVIAASLLAAILALPAGFQAGRISASTQSEKIVVTGTPPRHETSDSESQEDDLERISEAPSATNLAADATSNTPSRDGSSAIEAPRFDWLSSDEGADLRADRPLPTAFRISTLDRFPRSNWLALQDEPAIARETMALGDVDDLVLGFQVNQR